jgi:hypothetical protein
VGGSFSVCAEVSAGVLEGSNSGGRYGTRQLRARIQDGAIDVKEREGEGDV